MWSKNAMIMMMPPRVSMHWEFMNKLKGTPRNPDQTRECKNSATRLHEFTIHHNKVDEVNSINFLNSTFNFGF